MIIFNTCITNQRSSIHFYRHVPSSVTHPALWWSCSSRGTALPFVPSPAVLAHSYPTPSYTYHTNSSHELDCSPYLIVRSELNSHDPWIGSCFSSLTYFEKSLIYNIIQRLRIVTLIDIMKLNVLDDCKDYRNSQSHYIRLSRDCGPAASAPPLTLSRFFVDVGHAIKLVVQTQSACFWE